MSIAVKVTYKELSDKELVQIVLKGDDCSASSVLMKRYANTLRYELLQMVYNKSDAEYLAIQGLAKAMLNIKLYNPEFAFSTWLFTVAKNNCIDFIREKKRMPNTISIDDCRVDSKGKEMNVELRSGGLSPEEEMIKKQRANQLYRRIATLDTMHRIIINQFYLKEMSLKEISENLNIPLNTVKVTLFRARIKLQKLYNLS